MRDLGTVLDSRGEAATAGGGGDDDDGHTPISTYLSVNHWGNLMIRYSFRDTERRLGFIFGLQSIDGLGI